mmetsp:Transcript_24939/g.83189  ORF Transcript_24939/g.83189 Transcript_24939/m.83189 type:complete len:226 (+) Transcript_24939:1196-1873(+)
MRSHPTTEPRPAPKASSPRRWAQQASELLGSGQRGSRARNHDEELPTEGTSCCAARTSCCAALDCGSRKTRRRGGEQRRKGRRRMSPSRCASSAWNSTCPSSGGKATTRSQRSAGSAAEAGRRTRITASLAKSSISKCSSATPGGHCTSTMCVPSSAAWAFLSSPAGISEASSRKATAKHRRASSSACWAARSALRSLSSCNNCATFRRSSSKATALATFAGCRS